MTRGDLPNVTLFDRPIKPVAFGLSFTMAVLVIVNLADAGSLGDSVLGDITAVGAGISCAFLWAGWWGRSQLLAELGLLIAFTIEIIRSIFIAIDREWWTVGVWLGFGTAIIAGGAYMLERWDR